MSHLKFKLSHKLFGAFLLTTILTVVLMGVTNYFNISGDFANYIEQAELARHETTVEILATYYRENGDWERLRDNRRAWRRIFQNQFFRDDEPERRHNRSLGSFRGFRRVSLLDNNRSLIFGRSHPPEMLLMKPIRLEGETIGWLAIRKGEELTDPLALGFLKQQSQAFWIIGGLAIGFAALVSFFLARHFLAPIHQLTEGTQSLKNREFHTRIPVQTKDELGTLAANFNVMAETLERYEEMRKEWIADVSHELRTPLAILRGEIEAMQDGIRQPTPENLDSLHREVQHISQIVHDLSDLLLSDSGGLSFQKSPANLLEILQGVLKLYQARFADRNITVETQFTSDHPIVISGDTQRLTQLFTNLLENNLRYTTSPGSLKLILYPTADTVHLAFEDSGPGVPEKAVERLFERLYRVDKSRSRAMGGSGLGLSICQHIVEHHGGTIQARNAPNAGLRIEMQFPVLS